MHGITSCVQNIVCIEEGIIFFTSNILIFICWNNFQLWQGSKWGIDLRLLCYLRSFSEHWVFLLKIFGYYLRSEWIRHYLSEWMSDSTLKIVEAHGTVSVRNNNRCDWRSKYLMVWQKSREESLNWTNWIISLFTFCATSQHNR